MDVPKDQTVGLMNIKFVHKGNNKINELAALGSKAQIPAGLNKLSKLGSNTKVDDTKKAANSDTDSKKKLVAENTNSIKYHPDAFAKPSFNINSALKDALYDITVNHTNFNNVKFSEFSDTAIYVKNGGLVMRKCQLRYFFLL